MQWPDALYGFYPQRLQSHLQQGTCTVLFVQVCGNGLSPIPSPTPLPVYTVSSAIVRSWLRSTATWRCILGYTSVTLVKQLIIDPTNSGSKFLYYWLMAIGEFTYTNVTHGNRLIITLVTYNVLLSSIPKYVQN